MKKKILLLSILAALAGTMTGQIARLRGMEAAVKSRLAGLVP